MEDGAQMTRPAKLDCLDGLRGIAILAVVFFHHRIECQLLPSSTLYRLLAPTRFGFVGVHLFLVLSGFCLTNSLIRKARAGRNYSLRQYLTDRWWRIAPPFYAAIILCLIARPLFRLTSRVVLGNEALNFSIIAKHIFFVHGLSDCRTILLRRLIRHSGHCRWNSNFISLCRYCMCWPSGLDIAALLLLLHFSL